MVDWLSLSESSGSGYQLVSVTALPNSGSSRTTTLVVSGHTISNNIVVEQDSIDIIITPITHTFENTGGTQAFSVYSKGNWSVTSYPNWITLDVFGGGSGTTVITATASTNTGSTVRTSSIVVSGVAETASTYISQNETPEPVDLAAYLTFTIVSGGTIVWGRNNGDYGTGTTIYYNVNNTGWNELSSISGTPVSVNAGDVVKFKGDYNTYGPRDNPVTFSGSTASFSLSGNIMSLNDSENFSGMTQIPYSETFPYLFASCNVIEAHQLLLPATTLKQWCYVHMFSDCTSLISAPALPATSLTYYCYFNMFNGCTSLTTAPELPAKSLINYCYFHMFENCSSLNYIKCLATIISASGSHTMWLGGVASTGTFVKPASMTGWSTGSSGIPSGWTVEDA